MRAVKKPGFILLAGVVLLTIGLLWATVTWVPSDGAVTVWTAETGYLRVSARGLAVVPRWSGERSGARTLVAKVRATTSDGANVDVTVSLRPPVGVWRLQPAKTAREGFRRNVADPVGDRLGELPLRCVVQRSVRSAECPTDPAMDLRRVVAMDLEVPEGAVEVALEPEPEFIAKLKDFGHIGEGGVSAGRATVSETAEAPSQTGIPPSPTPQSATVTRGHINNLAVIKINQKKYDEAERLLRQAIAMSPQYASTHFNLRRIFMEKKQYGRADEELWIAIDKGLRDPERTVDRAAADYESMSLPDRADALLVRAIQYFPEHEPYYVHLMVVRVREGRFTEALPIGAVAAEKFPESGPVHAFYGLAAASAGQAPLARRELELSLTINPEQPVLRQALAQLGPAVSN